MPSQTVSLCGGEITALVRPGDGIIEIDLASMENGFYFATLTDWGSRSTYRILKL